MRRLLFFFSRFFILLQHKYICNTASHIIADLRDRSQINSHDFVLTIIIQLGMLQLTCIA